jgi:AmmeMemoRadiSam system protein B
MKLVFFFLFALSLLFVACINRQPSSGDTISPADTYTRSVVDTIGFAQYEWQMDSIVTRIYRYQKDSIKPIRSGTPPWKVCISPHDDYTYVGYPYINALSNLKASTLILFGVAHKASRFNLENKIIFDRFDYWTGPYGKIKVSDLRNKIMNKLDTELYEVHDSMQVIEHSLEALIPFLQYFIPDVQIVPILVPYMEYSKMEETGAALADILYNIMDKDSLVWGKDIALVISTDAVHYGDEDWGGKNFARYGTDSTGTAKAVKFEHKIISDCLIGEISLGKIRKFTGYTVKPSNFKEYKWTWCGRYSVPFGLATAYFLQKKYADDPLEGFLLNYANSIDHPHLPVNDLGMGITAPANQHHWVGYAALGYYSEPEEE